LPGKRILIADEDLRLKLLMPLFELSNALMSEVNLERLLTLVVEIVSHETRADRVSLMLLDESGRELAIKAAVGLPPDVVRTAVEKVGHGIAGSVAKSGKPILLNGEVEHKGRAVSGRTSSALCVPLAVGGRVIGVLNSSKTGEESRFTQSDLQLLSILAGQAAIAIENARLFQSVEVQQARLEELLRELLKAQEEERERISAEIHDSVAQWMVSASYHAQSSSALILESKLDEASDELEHATRIIGQSIGELRRIVTDLYPPALTELGLQEALRQNIECFRKETGVQCRLSGGLTRTLSPVHQIVVYRVVQEALNNVRKHAHASQVDIKIRLQRGRFRVEVSDNGRGFKVAPALEGGLSEGRMGLLTMKGRAEMLGGSLNIESSDETGTRVVLTIPLSHAGAARLEQSGMRGGVA
jgi:signal transduction histidine kinase